MCQPWFYLGLVAHCFFRYPRGPRVGCETGCPRHRASNFAVETRSRTRVSQVPGKPPLGLNPGDGTDYGTTQAVCGFRYLASKLTPLFQTIRVIAAILRARVSRAISGFIPLPI